MTRYDVFLSYNWRDHTAVEAIARTLRDHGLTVFLDRWYLLPGRPWPQALEEGLNGCRAVAVFLGPNGMGPWQQREKDLALDRQTRDPSFPVIPVLLPGADPALGFLALNTWVDLRAGLDDPMPLSVLAAAVRGESPGPDLQERLTATLATLCPYRGLHPFREEDAPFFFGRETFTSRLVEVVDRHTLVAVVGASGSGKSSVVRAGLVPLLRRGGRRRVWDVVTLVPGDRPLHALAAALIPLLEPEMTETDRLAEVGKLASYLAAGHVALRDAVAQALQKQPGTDRLLLVVDQWEELYTLSRDDQARRRFVDELLDATAKGALSVVLTLRGDFFSHVLSDRSLGDRLEGAVAHLGPMLGEELALAVEAPAHKVGLRFEIGLVTRILDAVAHAPGSLPLLEFVLTALWEKRRGGQLLHEAYEAVGAVQGAIAARADETFEGLTPLEKEAARRVFLQLVRPEEGTEDTRRRATMAEVGEAAQPVVQALTKARLLVTGRDEATGEEKVEVVHEALIRHWWRLQCWINKNREFLLWRQRLRGALANWERTEHDAGVLLRGAPLAEAERWLTGRPDDLNPDERDFILESVALRMREAETERRRRWRSLGLVMVVLMAAVAVVSVLSFVLIHQHYKKKNMGYFPKVSNPLAASLHLYRVQGSGIEEIKDFDGNGVRLQGGNYYLQAKKENWILKYPVYIEGYDHQAKPVVVQLATALSIPQDMAYISEGWFRMGDKEGAGYPNERPSHDVYVDAFMIDISEVSNPAYKKFVEQGGYQEKEHWTQEGWEWKERLPEGAIASVRRQYWDDDKFTTADDPIVGITWYEASAYCKWVGKRLPTEAEWEKAARGPEGYRYAFGNADDLSRIASKQPNSYGLYNMTGGVWEWVFDRYGENYYQSSPPEKNPRGPDQGEERILRGGSSNAQGNLLRTAFRWDLPPDHRMKTAGLRCVRGNSIDPR